MKHTVLTAVLAAVMLLNFTGCGERQQPEVPPPAADSASALAPEPERPPEQKEPEQKPPETVPPAKEEICYITDEWLWPDGVTGDQYHLILGEDHTAQLVHQDYVGSLLDLSAGTWVCREGGKLELVFENHMRDSQTLETPEQFGGTYAFAPVEENLLELACLDGADPLFPEHGKHPALLQPLSSLTVGDGPLDPLTEASLCVAATEYYAAFHGGYRPGNAMVDSVEDEGVYIHLYDDMGTHTATCAWYVVDPLTLQGYDDMTGQDIDLTEFFNQGRG